ncbi:phosphotransferase family protein [Micromonospora sp. NPDC048930]|uniref:phosphotransferase family protein n=1 Tax=Micromonospora sp. NPDC048930 TaxID=3364261 RepID=UPI0037159E57
MARRLARWIRGQLAPHDTAVVADLLAGLDDRLDRVRDCGLPDTLVHGDLHPGNVRGDGRRATFIDWGDAFVGHPAFDILRFTETMDARSGRASSHSAPLQRRPCDGARVPRRPP